MLEPILALALTVQNGKGVYALLLGSGISRAAGIPTGWDIVLDLIAKLHRLSNTEELSDDIEAWYRQTFKVEPDYSDILERVTRSSAERLQLLRSYFEPTEDEREHGLKVPTAAHRAIASLIANGYIRVVITTNFDRLLEHALTDVGVSPTIISTPDAVRGATPLVHSPCTIIKVHGDYLDARLKNTTRELETYDPELNLLLDRALDEYGLIVCGWSGEWDSALRGAVERCSTHRYGTYWAVRGDIGPQATKLISIRRSAVIRIPDANSFFQELREKVEALEDFTLGDPISRGVAVARTKRYLARPEDRIRLHDFVISEVERALNNIQRNPGLAEGAPNAKSGLRTLRLYEAELGTLVPVFGCFAYWGGDETYDIIAKLLKQVADNDGPPVGGYTLWIKARRYPALLLFYATALAAIAGNHLSLLDRLFRLGIKPDKQTPEEKVPMFLSPFNMWNLDEQRQMIEGREREHTPLNNHLFELLQPVLREYFRGQAAYEQTFNWFEYVLALIHCDQTFDQDSFFGTDDAGNKIRLGPLGRFFWMSQGSNDSVRNQMALLPAGQPLPTAVQAAIATGLCRKPDSSFDTRRYEDLKHGFDVFVNLARRERRIFL